MIEIAVIEIAITLLRTMVMELHNIVEDNKMAHPDPVLALAASKYSSRLMFQEERETCCLEGI